MKRYIALLACLFALTACGNDSDTEADASANGNGAANGDNAAEAGDVGFENEAARRSYALGMDIGNSLKELPVELDVDMLTEGVRDTVSDGETRLSPQELEGVMQSFVQQMQAAQQESAQQAAQANLETGEEFLAENQSAEGVQVTESGLQYKIVEEGSGPSPSVNDSVTVHYEGRLLDGTVFDSSRERGEPVTFPVDAVIPGWTEALQLMEEGAQYTLFIPANLAYGERGAGAQIGPNETLIFEVELLEVNAEEGGGGDAGGAQGEGQTDAQGEDQIDAQTDAEAEDNGGAQGEAAAKGEGTDASQ